MKSKLTVKAYAKLNLFLDITGRLPDGYHSLNTVMQSIDLCDTVTVEKEVLQPFGGSKITVKCNNKEIPLGEKNIAYKAASLFMQQVGKKHKLLIEIKKRIPTEAGLGGSSTDGAAVLAALNKMYDDILPEAMLLKLAEQLGADVPFCLSGGTKICGGIGSQIFECNSLPHCYFVIVKPNFSCNTAEAYKLYDAAKIPVNEQFMFMKQAFEEQDLAQICSTMYNVFTVLYNNDEIKKIIADLKENGALNAELTGSGSAVFGVFTTLEKAEKAKKFFIDNNYSQTSLAKPVKIGYNIE